MRLSTLRVGLCASLLSSSLIAHAGSWPKFAGTYGNTAFSSDVAPKNLLEALVTNSPHLGIKQSSSLAINYGNVYAYANGATGTLYCLDARTLAVKWAAPVPVNDEWGWGSWATPCVMNSSIVFAADAFLGCWNLDGTLRWQTTLSHETVNSSPVIVGNRVIVGCFSYMNLEGGIGAYDLATGSQLWFSVAIPNSTFSSCTPAVDEAAGRIYAACSNQVWCTDLTTGQILWRSSAPGAHLQLNNVSLAENQLFAVNYDFTFGPTNLFAFNAEDGTFLWGAACGMSDVPPAVYENLVLHSCGDNLVPPAITAFDRSTGQQVWQRTGLGSMYVTPAIAHGVVYAAVGVYSGWSLLTMSNLTALSVNDGSVLSATADTRGGQAPAIADDVLYTVNNGVVYAYGWRAGTVLFRSFSVRIDTNRGAKDRLKFAGILVPYGSVPDLGQLSYMRIGDFVVHGTPLSFTQDPDRPYVFDSNIRLKKFVPNISGSAKNGVFAGMITYPSSGGFNRITLPVTLLTSADVYFKYFVSLEVRAKKGKLSLKALPPNVK